ncbi:unnamed protein product [Linum trigynum]|uniref:DUF868 family protein n=1 Tax=Linum trigynum TaxID=586398 RepID=A0AAV2DNW3_9ROSI
MSQSSPFPSCFRPSAASDSHHRPPSPPPPPPPLSGKPNLTTCFYQTELGVFSLTWSRTFLGHSLHLDLLPIDHHNGGACSPLSLTHSIPHRSAISFHLQIKPFVFWKKHGSKALHTPDGAAAARFQIFWDLSRAKFGSGPEPQSGFYIAVVADREIVLLVGDLAREACGKTKARRRRRPERASQSLVLRREHVFGNRIYTTKARFGGRSRQISIDCNVGSDARLSFAVEGKRVLQIKRLKWKFRGNERIEVDGVPIQISWDVYNWLFEDGGSSGHAVFMFRFESEEEEYDREDEGSGAATPTEKGGGGAVVPWQPQGSSSNSSSSWGGFGVMNGIEWRKMKKSLMMRTTAARSSSWSSISMSSASSIGTNSSVMEWASVEESELGCGPHGFSLLVYAWKK